ncbi:acyltransferase domain-containing protein [Gloeobacter morelensis]|uniref:Type I polyketide synthase n=1 Tax=Gloeobacter morelensis MG652769 TaxID=2781736 RepID=A0ABY3PGZ3_9CYAN|nr:acyltransferase domain-containing protein [Gloeobacter morelensis]UFP92941.1 type I polyketide synthase [Gloeobacter morelensis MG652769]
METQTHLSLAMVGMDIEGGLDAFAHDTYLGHDHKSAAPKTPQRRRPGLDIVFGALNDAGLCERPEAVAVLLTVDAGQVPAGPEIRTRFMAEYFARCGHSVGPICTITEETSAFKTLETARQLLTDGQVEAVVIGEGRGLDPDGGAAAVSAAVVLKTLAAALGDRDRIYAVLEAIALVPQPAGAEPEEQAAVAACRQALMSAGLLPEAIDYLAVVLPEISGKMGAGFAQVFGGADSPLHYALGGGQDGGLRSGISSLIQTALAIYYRFLPASPAWPAPEQLADWQDSGFYTLPESRPWLSRIDRPRRAGLQVNEAGTAAHLILAEAPGVPPRISPLLARMPLQLLLLVGQDPGEFEARLQAVQSELETVEDLAAMARRYFAAFAEQPSRPYVLALVGRNRDEMLREIQRACKGIPEARAGNRDWKTPLGSYFTPAPLGAQAGIAFVYPGAFNSYLGLGRDLLPLFPDCHRSLERLTDDPGLLLREAQLYPRSLERLCRRQLEVFEAQLAEDPVAMIESGVGFAVLHTAILRGYFGIEPRAAFGYSLGETSMFYALGAWQRWDSYAALRTSPLFRTVLSGPMQVLENFWGDGMGAVRWGTYVLMAPPERVRERLKTEERVFLTHVNTPEEVVIAGEEEACRRVIAAVGCECFRAPASHVLHCPAMQSAYPELLRLSDQPVHPVPGVAFYCGASGYTPVALTPEAVAPAVAGGICRPVDFRRLIEQTYTDGARIFVELGPASTCSRWITETLGERAHLAVSINKRGTDDHTGLVQLLARLVSHRVALDLAPLFGVAPSAQPLQATPAAPVPAPVPAPFLRPRLEHALLLSEAHSSHLQARQEGLQQIGALVQWQIALASRLVAPGPGPDR